MNGEAATAVILARGLGRRMQAHGADLTRAQEAAAESGQKGMMPVGGRPLLDYVLHELADGGVNEAVFVVAPDDRRIRKHFTTDAQPRRVSVRVAVQQEPRGTADALLAAREAVGERPFLMLNADNLYPAASVEALVTLGGPGLVAYAADALIAGGIPADRVLQFALLDIAPDGSLRAIAEKPGADHPLARAAERWVSMNLWRFEPSIFSDCESVTPSVRGELELADAVRRSISRGVRFTCVCRRDAVLDLSTRGDVAAVEAQLKGREPRP